VMYNLRGHLYICVLQKSKGIIFGKLHKVLPVIDLQGIKEEELSSAATTFVKTLGLAMSWSTWLSR
jgi:hypothetical protein